MHINPSTDGTVAPVLPVSPAPSSMVDSAAQASSGWTRFWSNVEAVLFYGILGFGLLIPFLALAVKFIQG